MIWMDENLEISHTDVEHKDGTIERVLGPSMERSRSSSYSTFEMPLDEYRVSEVPRLQYEYGSTAADGTDRTASDVDTRDYVIGLAQRLAEDISYQAMYNAWVCLWLRMVQGSQLISKIPQRSSGSQIRLTTTIY